MGVSLEGRVLMGSDREKLREFLRDELRRRGRVLESDQSPLFSSGLLDSVAAVRLILFVENSFKLKKALNIYDISMIDNVDRVVLRLCEALEQ